MRFLLVVAIWLVLVGGLALYGYQRDRQLPPQAALQGLREARAETCTLEITPSFTTAADPFALKGDPGAAATLLVRTADRELFRSERALPAGVTQTVNPVPGLVEGNNEIYLRAAPPHGETLDHAVRVRLLLGGRVVVDSTIWGERGALVSGAIPFRIEAAGEGNHERH